MLFYITYFSLNNPQRCALLNTAQVHNRPVPHPPMMNKIKQVVLRQTWGEKTQLMRTGTRQLTQELNAKQNFVLFHFRLADWGSPPPALLLVLNLSNSCSRVSSTNRTFVVEIWHEMERDGHRNRQKEKTEGLQHHYPTACLCVSTQNQQNKESLSYVTLPISAARLDPETEAG